METISSFQRRLDDMHNATPRPLKRKIWSNYSTPGPSERYGGNETQLLSPFEKRMKSAKWEPRTSTRTKLFPTSVQPLQSVDTSFKYNLGFFNQFTIPQFSPRPVPAGDWGASRKAVVFATPGPPSVLRKPERAYDESRLVPRDSDTLSSAWFIQRDRDLLNRVEKDRENEVLREDLKAQRAFSRDVMEALERENAARLKQELELETFKRMVALNERKHERLESEFQNVTGRTEGISFLPSEEEDLRPSVSSSIYFSGRLSRSGSQSDEDHGPSGSKGREIEYEPTWKVLLNRVNERSKIEKKISLDKEIEYTSSKLQALQLERPAGFKAEKKPEDKTLVDAFTPLSVEAEEAVEEALEGGNRYEILVTHEKSNIDVTRNVMQCLLPGVWLNDEVINVYMELLKERELREPDRFLNCHFFNTFFYNKLFKDKRTYDYKSIRRWTTQKKLGYSLSDCDKILVPIHQDIHWCLAVINIRDKRLEYLDSLKGGDRSVLDVLARYITDEAKDKDGKVLDASTWERDFPKNIPEQMNGFPQPWCSFTVHAGSYGVLQKENGLGNTRFKGHIILHSSWTVVSSSDGESHGENEMLGHATDWAFNISTRHFSPGET